MGLVVDGPLGPAGRAKPGAVVCARREPAGRSVRSARPRDARLSFPRTWSGIYLPLPFTRLVIVVDDIDLHAVTIAEAEPLTETLSGRLANARADAIRLASRARW